MAFVLRNGLLVTPAGIVRGGLVAEDGIITFVGPDGALPSGGDVLDARGNWVLPGLLDPHTHIGLGPSTASLDRLKACWESESRAAVHRGITTVMSFQGGSPIPMEEPHVPMLERQIAWAQEASYTDFALHAIMQTDGHLEEQAELAERGVVGFKHFYTAYKPGRDATSERVDVGYADDGMLYRSFENLGRLRREGANVMGMIHAEDADICSYLEAELRKQGRTDLAAWAEARPELACLIRSQAAAEIADATGCPLYIVHITTASEVELVRQLRARGVAIYGETVVHYLTHTCDMEERHGSYGKVVPSIKTAADRDALWRGLADGTLTTVGTDHCTWTKEEKLGAGDSEFGNIWNALPGMTGMEFLLPVLMTFGVRPGRLSVEDVARVTSENPARQFGLYPRKGSLSVGADADLVVVDPHARATVDERYHHGWVTDWSIYDGWEFEGMPVATVVGGEVMVVGGELVGEAGRATYVGGTAVPRQPRPAGAAGA